MTKRWMASVAGLAALLIAGCGGSGVSSVLDDPELFLINASIDAGAIQLQLDDVVEVANIGYLGRTANFFEVEVKDDDPDGYDVSIHEQAGGLELIREAHEFGPDTDTILLIHGIKNFGTEDLKRLRIANFTVDRTVVNGNRARLIIVHAMELAPGFGTPSISFKNPGDNAQFQTGNISPGGTSVLEVDSGTNAWEVRRAGSELVYASANFTFDPGGVYLVVVSGVDQDPNVNNQIRMTTFQLPTVQ